VEDLAPEDFEGERLRRPGVWAVAYLATWCPFCREFRPRFEQLDGAGPFRIAVADLTDESNPLWDRFRIEVVPTVIAFREGRPIHRIDGIPMEGLGSRDLDDLRAFLKPAKV